MKRCIVLLALLVSCGQSPAPPQHPSSSAGHEPTEFKPQPASYAPEQIGSSAGPFIMKEGRKGWKIALPGALPLTSPAYSGGKLYIGGGFGSHEFYCLDPDTGKIVWEVKTGDDGPTTAVVEGGYVVFNTESCTIYTLDALTGKPVWSKWLGDPLLSQPALADGKVYMAYPGRDGSHHLICMTVKDGAEIWDQKIAGDIIAAPIVHAGSVYLTTFDGTLYRYDAQKGTLAWSEKREATSPPWIWGEQLLVSQGNQAEPARPRYANVFSSAGRIETLSLRSATMGGRAMKELEESTRRADYLDASKQGGTGGLELSANHSENAGDLAKTQSKADGGVGFSIAPETAKLSVASANVGVKTVCGAWAYQGSRPSVSGEICYAAMGDVVLCHNLKSGRVLWEKSLRPPKPVEGMRLLAPPALANGRLFLSTALGDVVCMDATGVILWSVNVGEPIVFQPTVMKGRVFVGTSGGHVVSIETGDAKDDGWPMWGGSPAHNGPK